MLKNCGIMQPYFVPYIGYFQLMDKCDDWIVFNNTQYIDKGWINRNRITNVSQMEMPLWFTIPVNKSNTANIIDIRISLDRNWKSKLTAQFQTIRKRSKYFEEADCILKNILNQETASISEFLVTSLRILKDVLEIRSTLHVQNLDFPEIHPGLNLDAGCWALALCQKIGADTYTNPIGGKSLFDATTYRNRNTKRSREMSI